MSDYNKIVIIGNLVNDPEMRFTVEGKAVTKFRIASNGYKKEDVTFVPIVCFGKTAKIAGELFKKGKKVLIDGRLSIKQFDGQNGEKKSFTEIIANELQILAKKGD